MSDKDQGAETDHEGTRAEGEDEETEARQKPASKKLRYDADLGRREVAEHFRALVEGMAAGQMTLRHGDEVLTLTLPERIEVEVRAADKGEKGKFSLEVRWRRPDADEALEIVPAQE